MKYGNALYIVVALFMVTGLSAMAVGQETTNKFVNNVKTNVDNYMSNLGTSVLNSVGANTPNSKEASQIPEFPALIIPVATIIGLMVLFQHKKTKEQK